MGLVFGMDEAGYGPNLGPLVITVTAWEVPGPPGEMDFWDSLRPIIVRTHEEIKARDRLLVADSKEVYSPARGLRILEESVLTLLSPIHPDVTSFQQLYHILTPENEEPANSEPWYAEDLPLPHSAIIDSGLVAQWQATCRDAGIVLRGVASDLVLTERYNNTVRIYNSKGLALSRMSLALLRSLWDPDSHEPTLILADKHGGRNRYDELLAEVLEDRFIFRVEEGTARSRYRVGKTDLCIQSKAESHFPVAVASMISKYLRELAMTCFNRFWQSHLPHLKPTKGYPLDARRFREEIVSKQKELAIPDATLWRER